jgi:hypothetical protein
MGDSLLLGSIEATVQIGAPRFHPARVFKAPRADKSRKVGQCSLICLGMIPG